MDPSGPSQCHEGWAGKGSGRQGSEPSGTLGALGTLVQPSCCRWGCDGHELVLGFLAHPSLPPQMDPVQKAVLSHTFGGPLLKTKRPIISCNVCQIRFNSQVRNPAAHPPEGGRGSQGIWGGEGRGWEHWMRGRD